MLFSLGLALAAPFPDLLAPAGAAAPSGASAVVIGLEDYGFLPDVPFARRDAAAVCTVLTTSLGLDPQRVRTLNSGNRLIGGAAATVVGVPLTVLGIRGMARKRQRVVDEVSRAHGFD